MSDVAVVEQYPAVQPGAPRYQSSENLQPPAKGRFTPFTPGNQYSKGHGRPKGSRAKLAEMFWRDLHDAWQEDGIHALKQVAKNSPAAFARIVASQMPREFLVKASEVDELSDADLFAFVVAARSEAEGDAGAEGGEDSGGESGEEITGGQLP